MENKKETIQVAPEEEIKVPETKEKKKIFTKKNLKRAGMIIGGAVVAGVVMLLGFAALGSKTEDDSESEDEVEVYKLPDDSEKVEEAIENNEDVIVEF